jgi:rRNA-processing protein FCF1
MKEDKGIQRKLKILRSNGFRNPLQVVLDCSFLRLCERIENGGGAIWNLLRADILYLTTECEYRKYEKIRKKKGISGECKIVNCKHEESHDDCVLEMVGPENRNHYIVGTINRNQILRIREGQYNKVPILRMKRKGMDLGVGGIEFIQKAAEGCPASHSELRRLRRKFSEPDSFKDHESLENS